MATPFPPQLEQEIEAIRASAEDAGQALVPMMRAAQRELGWLADDTLAAIARSAGVDAEDAANIAAYFDLRRAPPAARHVVEVCVNVSCRRRGGEAILARAAARLGLASGETSADGRVLLDEIVCLKRCESGPSMRVDHEIHDELTPARVDEILAGIAGGG